MVIAAPVLLLIALRVKVGSRGPALFRQSRIGRDGCSFEIIKFRTMVPDAEAILATDTNLRRRYEENNFKLATESDPRITPFGRTLRAASLDELPQLWNVLRGDMSLVGVRPVPPAHFESFGSIAQRDYMLMQPGITGMWQVNGRFHAEDTMPRANTEYVEHWSLLLDIRILLKTLPAVVRRRGAV
ncbi:MAG: sugar transferase [Actinobacteria bacterium]|nr:sugar transferase [Actinomycetota bacterium]